LPKKNILNSKNLGMGEEEFPEVQGGGSLILAWQIRNKRVLVVGGGEANISFQ
jgi:precorrin-2 dehydrogenase/sirohydrochlorin ferrochelatase